MLSIAICDDERKIGAEIERVLTDTFNNQGVKHNIDMFFSGAKLSESIKAGTHYDLIFLDIEFAEDEINGTDVGRMIRDEHQNHLTAIVFISWEQKYAMSLFDIQPFHFLPKPVSPAQIESIAKRYLAINGANAALFTYKKGHDTLKVQVKDIVFVESYDRKLMLHLTDGRKEEFYGVMKTTYETMLKRWDFLFIHSAYAVNFNHIKTIKFDHVIMATSEVPLPISKHRRAQVREDYSAIMKRQMG